MQLFSGSCGASSLFFFLCVCMLLLFFFLVRNGVNRNLVPAYQLCLLLRTYFFFFECQTMPIFFFLSRLLFFLGLTTTNGSSHPCHSFNRTWFRFACVTLTSACVILQRRVFFFLLTPQKELAFKFKCFFFFAVTVCSSRESATAFYKFFFSTTF